MKLKKLIEKKTISAFKLNFIWLKMMRKKINYEWLGYENWAFRFWNNKIMRLKYRNVIQFSFFSKGFFEKFWKEFFKVFCSWYLEEVSKKNIKVHENLWKTIKKIKLNGENRLNIQT